MANLIIKPNSATGDKLIIQDRDGGAVLTTADSGVDSSTSVIATKTGTETLTNKTLTTPTLTTPTIDSLKLTPGTSPGSPVEGQMYYGSSPKTLHIYDGTQWITAGHGVITEAYTADSYTKLLIHSNTTNGSTSFVDSSAAGHTVTATNGTTHSTAQNKIGASSIDFDGNNELDVADHADFTFGTQDFTIDMWFYVDTASHEKPIFSKGYNKSGVNGGMQFRIDEWAGGTITFSVTDGTSQVGRFQSPAAAFVDSRWNHIAAVRRYGHSFNVYLNGIALHTASTDSQRIENLDIRDNTWPVMIGHETAYQSGNSAHMWGYLDEIRISVGIARWTSNFSVPH